MNSKANPGPATRIGSAAGRQPSASDKKYSASDNTYSEQLEHALGSLLELTVAVLERMEKKIGLASLRGLQSLRRQGPCMVTELAHDLDLLVSTASRLSDRLTEAGLITRSVSPTNRRATQLELAPAGHAVLDELVAMRSSAVAEVTQRMSPDERRALLLGAQAFARARNLPTSASI